MRAGGDCDESWRRCTATIAAKAYRKHGTLVNKKAIIRWLPALNYSLEKSQRSFRVRINAARLPRVTARRFAIPWRVRTTARDRTLAPRILQLYSIPAAVQVKLWLESIRASHARNKTAEAAADLCQRHDSNAGRLPTCSTPRSIPALF